MVDPPDDAGSALPYVDGTDAPDERDDAEAPAMLHMVVNTHNPESCAFRSEADDTALTPGIEGLGAAAHAKGATLQSFWVNTGSHAFFILLDAPNAHVVDEVIRDSGLTGRTHSEVYAILDMTALRDAESKRER